MYPNLKLYLWKTGIRQNQLAQWLNIHETLLSRIVNGYREPSPILRDKIATILHSDPNWLFKPSEKHLPESITEDIVREEEQR
jgi:transcriptional regulator with XRE-family HTH domain